MEVVACGNHAFHASLEDVTTIESTRVRRVPRLADGQVACDLLLAKLPVEATKAQAKSGPIKAARLYAEEPMTISLGFEKLGSVSEASSAADRAVGTGPSSHVKGPPLPSADEGGPLQHSNMCDALRDTAAHAPATSGITFIANGIETFESYADLLSNARRMLGALQSRLKVKQGDAMALQLSDTRLHLRTFWALALGGITPVTVAVPNQYAADNATLLKLLGAIAVLEAEHVLAGTAAVAPLRALMPRGVSVHDASAIFDGSMACGPEVDATVSSGDVLFFQLTSGSTGTPKCIPERHAAVVSHIRHSAHHCEYSSADVTLNWLPFDHVVPMLTFHLADVYLKRCGVQLTAAEVIADPLLWPRTMSERRVTHSWSPNFGFKLVAQAARAAGQAQLGIDLSCLKFVMNAGEQVTTEACSTFAQVCGVAPAVVQPSFGMAECCTCMTYHNTYAPATSTIQVLKSSLQSPILALVEDPLAQSTSAAGTEAGVTGASPHARFVSLGGVSPGVEIRICAPNGETLNELQVGSFHIRGPCVMQGYHNNPSANEECMLADGWLDSGDVGFVYRGELVLTGRKKEMIILRGANYYCYEIEDVVTSVGIGADGSGGVVATARAAATSVRDEREGTEQLLVFFVPADATAAAATTLLHTDGVLLAPLRQLVAAVRSQLGSALGLTARHVLPVSESQFLRTTSGKIQRTAFQKAFLAGTYTKAAHALDLALGTSPFAAPDFFAAAVWERKRPTPPPPSIAMGRGAIQTVIWVVDESLHDAVRDAWTHVCLPQAPDSRVLCCTDVLGASSALQSAAASGGAVTHIVHASMLYRGGGEDSAVATGGACPTLCDLARALPTSGEILPCSLDVLILRSWPVPSDAAPATTLAFAAAGGALAPGVCKALALETSCVGSCRLIDVPVVATAEQLASVALVEMEGGTTLDAEVEYRPVSSELPQAPTEPTGLVRLVKRLRNVGEALREEASCDAGSSASAAPSQSSFCLIPVNAPAAPSPALPGLFTAAAAASGSSLVVVSGGLGAVGVAVVQLLLAESARVRVLVLGRRSAAEVRAQLERLGWGGEATRVAYAAVTLGGGEAQYEQLVRVLRESTRDGGGQALPLVGVLHLAGVYERAPLASMSAEQLRSAACAKATGAVHLHRACVALGARPAFFHFGSTAALFAGAGLGAYAASNAFLEWFARWQRQQAGMRARTLVWTAWGTGISQRDRSLSFARWVSPMPTQLGLRIVRALLQSPLCEESHPDLIVGVNLREPSVGALFADGPVGLLTDCVFHTPEEVPTAEQCAGAVPLCVAAWPRLAGGDLIDVDALMTLPISQLTGATRIVPPQGPTEAAVASIWAEVLGQPADGLSREANFFDAGGTSIMWMKAVFRVNTTFDLKLAAMEIFEYGALADLAAHVDRLQASGGGQGWQPSACIEVLSGADTADATAPAVCLMPSATGTPLLFSPLLSRHPPPPGTLVLGVRDPTLVGKADARFLSFEERAELLATAITSQRAHGPYVLVAHGYGGVATCWACAEALERRGEHIGRLVLIDACRPMWRMSEDVAAFEREFAKREKTARLAPMPSAAVTKQGSPSSWLSRMLGRQARPPTLRRLPSAPAKLVKKMSSTDMTRREALTSSFSHMCGDGDAVWDFYVALSLERDLPLPDRQTLDEHPGAEDPIDFVCQSVANGSPAADVAQARAISRCVSDDLIRPLSFSPARLDTNLVLLTVDRSAAGAERPWPKLAETTFQGMATSVEERSVALTTAFSSQASQRAARLSKAFDGGSNINEQTLLCMYDDAFLAATHATIFGDS